MTEAQSFTLGAIWLLLPAGVANTAPVLVRRVPLLDAPIDGGRTLCGAPIFGANKTWRGLLAAPLAGWAVAAAQGWLAARSSMVRDIAFVAGPAWWGAVLGAGAILGDLFKSFAKRRVGIASGRTWIPFDQIDWAIGAIAALSWWYFPGWSRAGGLVAVGGLLHLVAVALGKLVGLRKAWI